MGKNNINKIKKSIINVLKKHKIRKAGIFGSYARGEEKNNSDIDILIQPTKNMSFFDIVRLEEELKKELKKRVDLLTYNGINHLLKDIILNEEVKII
jgi:hypothetical protein